MRPDIPSWVGYVCGIITGFTLTVVGAEILKENEMPRGVKKVVSEPVVLKISPQVKLADFGFNLGDMPKSIRADYIYNAKVVSVHDGDTFHVIIDRGDSYYKFDTVRLYGCDTPELKGVTKEAGLKAKAFAQSKIEGKYVRLQTVKSGDEKYDRYLAVVYYDEDGVMKSLCDELIKANLASAYTGGTKDQSMFVTKPQ